MVFILALRRQCQHVTNDIPLTKLHRFRITACVGGDLHIFTGRNEVVAKVIFLHLSVILFTGGVSASVHAGIPHPPGSRHPPGADNPPRSRSPLEQTRREQTPPGSRHPLGTDPPRSRHPPWKADSSIRSMSGRYTSYWNAFLFSQYFSQFSQCLSVAQ